MVMTKGRMVLLAAVAAAAMASHAGAQVQTIVPPVVEGAKPVKPHDACAGSEWDRAWVSGVCRTHTSAVADRFQNHVMPFFSEHLCQTNGCK